MEAQPGPAAGSVRIERAWYHAAIAEFLETDSDTIIGRLTRSSDFPVEPAQRDAWLAQIDVLREGLRGLEGSIYFEFNIPRMGRRVDVVLLVGPLLFVLEFKVGERRFEREAMDQVWDYALDLKNFHEGSHAARLLPILIATEAETSPHLDLHTDHDGVSRPIRLNPAALRTTIDAVLQSVVGPRLDAAQWSSASYRPTPTIVEAARALYAQHTVEAIARSDAGAQNLHVTAQRLEEIIDATKTARAKAICFVTGVPGAGKTLVGLDLATRRREAAQPTHAVFLSGNGPLVAVLREALARDEVARRRQRGERVRKREVAESVKAFIQNVHHFRDDALLDPAAPAEHVVIFDEAQRAWNRGQTASFMRRKKNRPGFADSEPEFLISCMDRHKDWAAIICLVGGGQEINTGEAGIHAWLEAVATRFPHWHTYISDRLHDSEYAAGQALEAVRGSPGTHFDSSLHLAVSMRSFRAEGISAFVKALLDGDREPAGTVLRQLRGRYDIVVTRDLNRAKGWIRNQARGSERYGLVASSKAQRLRPHAVDVRVEVNPVHWFLNDKEDVRSSYYLEDAATEFQVQGLELDWTCVTWDGDLRFAGSGWSYHDFRGDRWCRIGKAENQRYLRNAYRVLLTRARQGMAIFVPPGDPDDPTRLPEFYDATFGYLRDLGLPTLG